MSADLTLNDEAINLWRSTFRLNLNVGRKLEITRTVQDMELWKRVLSDWKANKWNPLKIGWQLSEYERRATDECKRTNGTAGNQRDSAPTTGAAGLSERSDGQMLRVREGAGVHLRRGGETFEEIFTRALRAND